VCGCDLGIGAFENLDFEANGVRPDPLEDSGETFGRVEGIGILFDRVRKNTGRKTFGAPRPGRAIHIENIDTERSNQFRNDDSENHRWLLTTCVAGIAGSVLLGGALLGVFGQNAAPKQAMASISPADATVESVRKIGLTTASLAEEKPEAQVVMVIPGRELDEGFAYPEITAESLPYGDGKTVVLESEMSVGAIDTDNVTTISKTPPAEPVDEKFKLAKRETIVDALVDRGVNIEVAQQLANSVESVFKARQIKAGTEFELTLDRQQDFYGRAVIFPVSLSFKPNAAQEVMVEADEDGEFVARLEGKLDVAKPKAVAVNHFRTRGKVGSSLYSTAKDNKVPDYITSELTRVFSYDVDFQNQVKASDSFEIFYGNPLTGSSTKRKVLHYAKLILNGQPRSLYRFTAADGRTGYFDENGMSAEKAILKTPVSGAKLTSGFGMRRHPLLRYSKMHTGVDFGAPTGTPIRAASSGTIEVAGRHGAYGIAIKIQHNGKYETLYAHMSRLAKGVRKGVRVNQGQIIGYVGSTGRSTGPHLHYEVRVNDRPVNPARIKSTGGKQLAGKDLAKFKNLKSRVAEMMKSAPNATQVASAGQ
jgi:murein DD-endopeptidase MepM/ murein hydrolase activator NlpD